MAMKSFNLKKKQIVQLPKNPNLKTLIILKRIRQTRGILPTLMRERKRMIPLMKKKKKRKTMLKKCSLI